MNQKKEPSKAEPEMKEGWLLEYYLLLAYASNRWILEDENFINISED